MVSMKADAQRRAAATGTHKAPCSGSRVRVPVARVRQHLQLLRRTMSVREIAEASSITDTSIWNILGGQATVMPATAAKILAVTPINGAVLLDSIGAQRRIQALATMGWTGETVGRLVAMRRGDTWANITRVMQEQQITASLAHEINAVYADLREKTPPADHHAKRIKELAQRSRWAPPAAWETVDIDDPNARPDWASVLCKFVACGRSVKPGWPRCEACLKRLEKHGTLDGYSPLKNGRALVEDALFISKNEGLSLRDEIEATLIAERLGVTLLALQQGLKRHSTVSMQAEELAEEGAQ